MMKSKQSKNRRSLKKKHSTLSNSNSEYYNNNVNYFNRSISIDVNYPPLTLIDTMSMNFTENNELIQPYEGQLYKYTNVVKGFQYRWFLLDPKSGLLNYYLHENEVKQTPRGSIYLENSVISPSDEDSCTFTVNSTSGDIFKLRASDAKFRQEWVNRLRAVAQFLTIQNYAQISSRGYHSMGNIPNMRPLGSTLPNVNSNNVWDSFQSVRDHLNEVERSHCNIVKSISELPTSGNVTYLDENLLLIKSGSYSLVNSLNQCLNILQQSTTIKSSNSIIGSGNDKKYSTTNIDNTTSTSNNQIHNINKKGK